MKASLALSVMLLLTGTLFAQEMRQHRQFYDKSTVTTIKGSIVSVDSQATPRGDFYMVRLTVKDTSGSSDVTVGPSTYLDSQGISFTKGDSIEVTGSKMNFRGNDVIVAAQIVENGKTIVLRDDSGRPVWGRQ